MTGNIGSEQVAKPSIGFGGSSSPTEAMDKLKIELKKFFRPEFLNRLNEIILFKDFEEEDLVKITKLEIAELSNKLVSKKIKLSVTPKKLVVSWLSWLLKKKWEQDLLKD